MEEQGLPSTDRTERDLFEDVPLARRFQRRLDDVRPGRGTDRAEPVLYDESGYPLDQRPLGVTGRLRRLITG